MHSSADVIVHVSDRNRATGQLTKAPFERPTASPMSTTVMVSRIPLCISFWSPPVNRGKPISPYQVHGVCMYEICYTAPASTAKKVLFCCQLQSATKGAEGCYLCVSVDPVQDN